MTLYYAFTIPPLSLTLPLQGLPITHIFFGVGEQRETKEA